VLRTLLEMLRRWRSAQKAEKVFWGSNSVVEKEAAEILNRYREVFSEINVKKNWKIFDLGCGPTVASRMIEGGEKYGVDPLMNDFIRKVQGKPTLKPFHFVRAIGERLPFKDACMDLVICRNVLDHVQSPEEALKEMKRISKDSATLVLGVNAYSEFASRIKKAVERLRIRGLMEEFHPHFFTEKTLQTLCSKHFSITAQITVFSDKSERIKFEAPTKQLSQQKTGVSILYSVLSSFSSWAFTFFWNFIRSLNQMKAPFFMQETVTIADNSSKS
jgi:ubiquinone/menaquinone biosynthesis C-methylase UbiE